MKLRNKAMILEHTFALNEESDDCHNYMQHQAEQKHHHHHHHHHHHWTSCLHLVHHCHCHQQQQRKDCQ